MSQIDLYSRNYWAIYLDFLDVFEGLTYKNYSLPYLCHFRSLIKHNSLILAGLENNDLEGFLINEVKGGSEIQKRFNSFINNHTISNKKNPEGTIIFHDVYNLLRIPYHHLKKYFSPEQVLFLYEKNATKKNSNNHFNIHTFDQYSTNIEDIKPEIKKINRKANKIFKSNAEHPLFSHIKFQRNLLYQFNIIIKRIEEAENLLNRINVSCIVLPSTHYPESRTLSIVASSYGIPSICLQHGIISGEYGYLPKIATIDAVYGPFEEKWYGSRGGIKGSTKVIGHPRFDLLFNKNTKSKTHFYKKLNLDPNKKTILLGVRREQHVGRWRVLLKELLKKNLYNLILRDFPNVNNHQLMKEFPQIKSTHHFTLHDVLSHSDAIIVYPSTVGLEAMLMDKPTFVLDGDFPGYTGYYKSLGELVQIDPSVLAVKVKKYFKSQKMQDYAKERREEFLSLSYPDKNRSTERLANLINDLIQ